MEPITVEGKTRELSVDIESNNIQTFISGAYEVDGKYKFPALEVASELLTEKLDSLGINNDIEVTEGNVKELKKQRTEINKMRSNFEETRLSWQRRETAIHSDFRDHAKETVNKTFDNYEVILATKIKEFEENKKKEVEKSGEIYWEELRSVKGLDFVPYEELGVKVGVNTSEGQVIKQIDELHKRFVDDITLINTFPNKERVLEKYKTNLDVTASMLEVQEEDRIIEEMKEREKAKNEELAKAQEKAKEPVVVQAAPPKPIEEEVELAPTIHVSVELKGDRDKINWLLSIAQQEGINIVKAEKKETGKSRFF